MHMLWCRIWFSSFKLLPFLFFTYHPNPLTLLITLACLPDSFFGLIPLHPSPQLFISKVNSNICLFLRHSMSFRDCHPCCRVKTCINSHVCIHFNILIVFAHYLGIFRSIKKAKQRRCANIKDKKEWSPTIFFCHSFVLYFVFRKLPQYSHYIGIFRSTIKPNKVVHCIFGQSDILVGKKMTCSLSFKTIKQEEHFWYPIGINNPLKITCWVD